MSKEHPPAPDQESRDQITEELGTTMLVEAAAGTGKTTLMVDRLVNLVVKRQVPVSNIAAVTFTRKAAAEMRERARRMLEKKARSMTGPDGENVSEALDHFSECFIGTIHSFCANLLHERPVEAGVPVDFSQIDEAEDADLREETWEEFSNRLYANDDPVLEELNELGLHVTQLRDGFVSYADYPDVEEWPTSDPPLPDLGPVKEALQDYKPRIARLFPFPDDRGTDDLMDRLENLYYHLDALDWADTDVPALMDALELVTSKGCTLKHWDDDIDNERIKEEKAILDELQEKYGEPLLRIWREKRYHLVMRLFQRAEKLYVNRKKREGVLDYQDLLLKTASLLKDRPSVRRYFRERYPYVLVDEFQDTDPIQAQILMYLTAQDPMETEWKECRPAPGSLFVVGDPKQSIYRFRRADIQMYKQVRSIIDDAGGKIVRLRANFRSVEPIIDWVNGVFEDVFPEEASETQAGRVRLKHGRLEGTGGDLSGLRLLDLDDKCETNEKILEEEPPRVAEYIGWAEEKDITVPRRQGETDEDGTASYDDFLVLTYKKEHLKEYAQQFQKRGIPYEITGGASLNEVPELDLLHRCLSAVVRPDNPIPLVGALRSGLFGVSDRTLYSFQKDGGHFDYQRRLSSSNRDNYGAIASAYEKMRTYRGWLAKLPPATACKRVMEDLGLSIRAASRKGGNIAAGSLEKALALLRAKQNDLHTTEEVVEYLGDLVDNEEEHDGIAARADDSDKVRIMNLHKAKGLEAPIVFLAAPLGKSNQKVSLHVDRMGDRTCGYMEIRGEKKKHHAPLLAHSPNWEQYQEREKEFCEAEYKRLLYVAATRARACLIVSQRPVRPHYNPWRMLSDNLATHPELPKVDWQSDGNREEESITADEVARVSEDLQGRWRSVLSPSRRVLSAKEASVSAEIPFHTTGGRGADWGTAVHGMLQRVMEEPDVDCQRLARNILVEKDLSDELDEELVGTVQQVMESDLWQRASESDRCIPEATFTTPWEAGEEDVPQLLTGKIDLVFHEDDGWVIVDYKTDVVPEEGVDALTKHYAPQLRTYKRAWERGAGQTVKELGLYLTDIDQYHRIAPETVG